MNEQEILSALKAKGVRSQGDVVNESKAGSFVGFEEIRMAAGFLAELNWRHVKEGEGEYQPAKA